MAQIPATTTHGELIEVACPEDTQVVQTPGFMFPSKDPVFVVVDVKDNRAWVGPMATGKYTGYLECSDGSEVDFKIELADLSQNELPEKVDALPPAALAYPVWIWIALALGLTALGFLGFRIRAILVKRKKSKAAKKKKPRAPAVPADTALERFLAEAQKPGFDGRETFTKGAERLRAYLELLLGFRGAADTTREFIASTKSALAVQREVLARYPEAQAVIERLLLQADQVRFAGDTPAEDTRSAFVAQLRELFSKLGRPAPKAAPAPPTKGRLR